MDKKELYKKVEDLDLFCLGIRKYVALSEVMYLIKQLDEPQKVVIPQYVADWYEENKGNLDYNLWKYIMDWEDAEEDEFKRWVNNSKDAFQTIINMHQFGYKVEKVDLYRVKLIHGGQYLHTETFGDTYFTSEAKSVYSKDKLSNLGFDWVFNCPGIKLEEVE